MLEDTDIRSFFDLSITHFPDRSARWLLQYIEYVPSIWLVANGSSKGACE